MAPQCIEIYSLDRGPAKHWVRVVPRSELENMAAYVEAMTGIRALVF